MRKRSGGGHGGGNSAKHHKQRQPRRGQDQRFPYRPWQADAQPDDPVSAAKRAVEHADALTQRFMGGK